MPCDYSQYPADWKERRARILARAGQILDNKGSVFRQANCEECGVENGLLGWRFPSGAWVTPDAFASDYMTDEDEAASERILQKPARRIILTIAHLDRTGPPGPDDGPLDCPDDRLKALCQRCHLLLDAARHQAKAAATRRAKAGLTDLFA